ncbi:MAG: GH25 family lysozyme [Bacteroidota bacterium]|nr:GH25 family lysozyme [Bacteroidota bacterium]
MGKRISKRKKQQRRQFIILLALLIIGGWFVVSHQAIKSRIQFWFYRSPKNQVTLSESKKQLNAYSVYGLDVSEYQDVIVWKKLTNHNHINFAFIRATAGKNHKDKQFDYNWHKTKKHGIAHGAYHYYRPNENSFKQASNFIQCVELNPGDLPPVLDIEDYSKVQSFQNLKIGLLRWLKTVEKHYGVKPIVYTYYKYYIMHFQNDNRFNGYAFWLARYGHYITPEKPGKNWLFWQFTEKGNIEGIRGNVDFNVFYDDKQQFHSLLME